MSPTNTRGSASSSAPTSYGRAVRTVIDGNRIHDCGIEPSHNQDHGIYLSASDESEDLQQRDLQKCRPRHPVVPGRPGRRDRTQRDRRQRRGRPVLRRRRHVEQHARRIEPDHPLEAPLRRRKYYRRHGPTGSNNFVRNNCIFGGAQGAIGDQKGYTASANKAVDPRYANPAAGNFSLAPGSRCSGYVAAGDPAGPPLDD